MDIRISGHQIKTGAALQEHASDRLAAITDKHFDQTLSADVTFGKSGAGVIACDIVMHVMQGLILKARGEAHDAHLAFEEAATKLEKQLRRYKRRLRDRHEQTAFNRAEEDAAYTVFAANTDTDADANDDDDSGGSNGQAPPIIAETRIDIPESNVADAVMLLDLRDTNALFFKNAGTGRHNMVYRRSDGSIGWVEPH
jgi:ribosomal subunit interface protein